jgi:hypothetical protein
MKKQYIRQIAGNLFMVACCFLILFRISANSNTNNTINPIKMDTSLLTQPIVKKAIDALQAGDKTAWFALFTDDAALYDDDNEKNFRHFFEKALGHERFTAIDKVENSGLHLYGRFHSDTWGNFKTYFKFFINPEGKIYRLDIGQADY